MLTNKQIKKCIDCRLKKNPYPHLPIHTFTAWYKKEDTAIKYK